MKNKKLITINLLVFTAFIFVVGIGIYQADAKKDGYGVHEQGKQNGHQDEDGIAITSKEELMEEKSERGKLEGIGTLFLLDKEAFVLKQEKENKEEDEKVEFEENEGKNNLKEPVVTSSAPVKNTKTKINERVATKKENNKRAEAKEKAEARKKAAEEEARRKAEEEAKRKEEMEKEEEEKKEEEKKEEEKTKEPDPVPEPPEEADPAPNPEPNPEPEPEPEPNPGDGDSSNQLFKVVHKWKI